MGLSAFTLSPQQRAAVTHTTGACQVLAGHGSGKTFVIELRAAWLVQEKGVLPESIGLLTFTRKAAGELRGRMESRIGTEYAERMRIQTTWSLALEIISEEKRLSDQQVPIVLDPLDVFAYFRRAMSELGLDSELNPKNVWETIARWKMGERDTALLPPVTVSILKRYQLILEAERKWDLSDLIVKAIETLAENQTLLHALDLQYLMVDEWQDSTLTEYRFIRALLNGNQNLMVVGSPAQAIYAWRGGDYQALNEQFRQDFEELTEITLPECRRSGPQIVRVGAAVVPEEQEVWMHSRQADSKVVVASLNNDRLEADAVAQEIKSLVGEHGLRWQDCAILVRTWSQSIAIERGLVNHRVPYVLYGDNAPLYDRKEVREMRAYLRIIQMLASGNDQDTRLHGAIDQIINTPARGIGPASQRLIRGDHAEISWYQLMGAMVNKNLRQQVRQATQELFDLLNRLSKKADVLTPQEMIQAVIRETGWEQWLNEELGGNKKLRNLKALADEAQQFTELPVFLRAVEEKAHSAVSGDGVAISTIHSAKGLEWPAVFVVGLNEGILPHIKAIESQPDPAEERRLAHVAFTRAKHLLFLSWFRERTTESGRIVQMKPSRFLAMLPKEDLHDYDPGNLADGILDGNIPNFDTSPAEAFASFIGQ